MAGPGKLPDRLRGHCSPCDVPVINVYLSTLDGHRESRRFATIKGARAYAQRKIGPHPEIGSGYAVSPWGDAKITVSGCTLETLFDQEAELTGDSADYASED